MKMDSLSNKQGNNLTPEKLLTLLKQKENLKIQGGLLEGETKPEEIKPVVEKTKRLNENEKFEEVRRKILDQMTSKEPEPTVETKEEPKTEFKEENIEFIEVKKLAQEKLAIIEKIETLNAELMELEKNTIKPEEEKEVKVIKIDNTEKELEAQIFDYIARTVRHGRIENKVKSKMKMETSEEEVINIPEVEEKAEEILVVIEDQTALSDALVEDLPLTEKKIVKKNNKLFKNYPVFKKLLLAGAILTGGVITTAALSKKDKADEHTYRDKEKTKIETVVTEKQKSVEAFTVNKEKKIETTVTPKETTETTETTKTSSVESEKPLELNVNQEDNSSTNMIESEKPTEIKAPSYSYNISGQREITNKNNQVVESERPVELKKQKQNKTPETTQTTTKESKKEVKEETKKEVVEEAVEKEDLTKKLYYDIQPRTLKKVNEVYESNLASLFSDNNKTLAWDNIKESKELTAEFMMNKKEGGSNGVYNPFISYLHKLHFKSGLNPKVGETNEEYVRRALQKLAKMEKLNEIKL